MCQSYCVEPKNIFFLKRRIDTLSTYDAHRRQSVAAAGALLLGHCADLRLRPRHRSSTFLVIVRLTLVSARRKKNRGLTARGF
jgi:hypothetical protein